MDSLSVIFNSFFLKCEYHIPLISHLIYLTQCCCSDVYFILPLCAVARETAAGRYGLPLPEQTVLLTCDNITGLESRIDLQCLLQYSIVQEALNVPSASCTTV